MTALTPAPAGNRIAATFARLKAARQAAFIPFYVAGDPDLKTSQALIEAAAANGADLIEIGVPFSDPIADGPVIQAAGERALKAGTTLTKVLAVAAEIRQTSEVPLLLFTYLNPVVRYGLDRLAQDAAAAGIDGCLLIDASVEEAGDYVAAMHRHGLDTVFLAAPTSTERRLKLVAQYSTGFIYLVSRTGVTGERDSLSKAVAPLVAAVRAVSDLPLAVGFGISKPEHVAELGKQVEAVVVGSAIVRLIERNAANASLEIQLESFVRELKHGFAGGDSVG